MAFAQAGIGADDPAVRRAVELAERPAECRRRLGRKQRQLSRPPPGRGKTASSAYQTPGRCWGCWRRARRRSDAVRRGAEYLLRAQQADGLWSDPSFTAPGFPRVFYLDTTAIARTSRCGRWPPTALCAPRNRSLNEAPRDRRRTRGRGAHPGPAVQRRDGLASLGDGALLVVSGMGGAIWPRRPPAVWWRPVPRP